MDLFVEKLTLGPFQSNCYLIGGAESDRLIVLDPGAEPDHISGAIDESDRTPVSILATHGHIDHVGAVADLQDRYDLPFYLHPSDVDWVKNIDQQADMFSLPAPDRPEITGDLEGGKIIEEAGLTLDVIHTPGHTQGEVSFVLSDRCFVGDCVFSGSIGRTDFPGGDRQTLLASIRDKILTLPDDTILHPGHGPDTTVEKEATSNPFLN